MKRLHWMIPVVCCVPLLSSCASPLGTVISGALSIGQAALRQQRSADNPEALYQLGRYFQGQGRLEQASAAYKRALAADSSFVEARNGLGVVYAMQGMHDSAIAEFQTALQQQPTAAHIHGNLGYAYYLKGAYGESIAALEKARALEPGNRRIQTNLALANEAAEGRDKLAPAPGQAPMPTVGVGPVAAAPDALPQTQPAKDAGSSPFAVIESRVEAVEVAHGVYELRERKPTAQAVHVPAAGKQVRIEVSNGNGVNGMARRVGQFLGTKGFLAARRTNQQSFSVAVTQIEYRSGYRAEALRLSSELPRKPSVVPSDALRVDVSIRVVLGKDMLPYVASFEGEAQSTMLAHNMVESRP